MKIGIIGAGNVGGALGRGWVRAGHEVTYGVRDVADPKVAKLKEAGARAASVAAAAKGAEVVVLATPWEATQDAVREAGDLSGKIVFDCTNPLTPDLSGLAHGSDTSGAEGGRLGAGGAGGQGVQYDRRQQHGEPGLQRRGGDDVLLRRRREAKGAAHQLAADLGFDPVDAGALDQAACSSRSPCSGSAWPTCRSRGARSPSS